MHAGRNPEAKGRSLALPATKLVLDFLQRPATMAPRQHSGSKPLQDGENPHGDDNTTAAREDADMAVWFKRRLQCLHCEESALFDAEIAPGAGRPRTPANDCRNNVLRTQGRAHALNHGGTIA
jgi:hypothetical protein